MSHARQRHCAPPEEQAALVKLGDATRMLAEVRDAPSAKKLMDLAAAAELYARKAKLGQDAVNYAAGVKLRAQRLLDYYLETTERAGPEDGRPSKRSTKERLSTLSELLSLPAPAARKLAHECKQLRELDDHTFEKVVAGEKKLTVAKRDKKRETLGDRIAALPGGKFRVIYADPPWKYGDERTGSITAIGGDDSRSDSSAADKYPTMPTSAICQFTDENGRHVSDLAHKDAVLFMWATFPLLEDALEVIRAWRFKYKTAFVWDKERSNVGNYHDARAELLMIATRGSCPIEIDTRPKQVQTIARGKHSAKPEPFRALIDEMYPSGPRVELFRRGAAPPGWTVWGNEIEAA